MRARSRQRSTRARGADAEGEHEAAGLEGGTDLCWGGTLARVHLDSWGRVFPSVRIRHQLAIFKANLSNFCAQKLANSVSFRGKQNRLRSAKHSRTMIDTWTPARLPHYRPWFLKKSCLVFASGLDGQAHGPDASGINQEDKMRQNMDGSQLKTGRLGTPHKWNRRLC